MEAVEAAFPPRAAQLPKDYERFEDDVLESMLRLFDEEGICNASGDVFRPIYETGVASLPHAAGSPTFKVAC
jgi:type I restriction enzyme M protein